MKRQVISLLLVLAAISGHGQNVSADNPGWLWTISADGLPGRSFLFGTCHGDGISFTDTESIDTLSMKEQAKIVYEFVHSLAGDSVFQNPKLHTQSEHLLRERNEAWIPVIKENIAKRPCLIAVGCRHLLSADGLIAMLRREGYTVEPVKKLSPA